jgi:hypothetical protein
MASPSHVGCDKFFPEGRNLGCMLVPVCDICEYVELFLLDFTWRTGGAKASTVVLNIASAAVTEDHILPAQSLTRLEQAFFGVSKPRRRMSA